jgi:hypothetical protein
MNAVEEEMERVGLTPQTPFARCDLDDTPEYGMVLTVNGKRMLLSPGEGAKLCRDLTAALMKRMIYFYCG